MSRGWSLVEVLVTLCILAVGVMGSVGLHLSMARAARQSTFQIVATHLAGDIAEHLRAMPAADVLARPLDIDTRGASSGSGSRVAADAEIAGTRDVDVPPDGAGRDAASCRHVACAVPALLARESAVWEERLRTQLPGARLRICRDARLVRAGEGAAGWDCSGGPDDAVLVKLGWRDAEPAQPGEEPPRLVLAVAAPFSP